MTNIYHNIFRATAPITIALSCSWCYLIGIDLYYRTFPTFKWSRSFKLKYLLNPGLIFGALLGARYCYLGKPLIN